MKNKLSVALITKNNEDHLEATLSSIYSYADEIVIVDNGSTDKTIEIARQFDAKIIEVNPTDNPEYFIQFNGRIDPHFTKLRRLSFENCTGDWILWLDSDDIVMGAEHILDLIEECEKEKCNVIVAKYLYEIDEEGITQKEHNKERIVKNGLWQWELDEEWAVHENLYPVKGVTPRGKLAQSFVIKHDKLQEDNIKSAERNFNILLSMLQNPKFQKDARVWFLVGREAISTRNFSYAVKALEKYLSMEYTSHDGLETAILLAEINEGTTDFKASLDYAMRAIAINPSHPAGYLYAARYLNRLGRYESALDFINQAGNKRVSELDSGVYQPYTLLFLEIFEKVKALSKLKMYEEAIVTIEQNVEKLNKEHSEDLINQRKELINSMKGEELTKAFITLINLRLVQLQADKKRPVIKDFDDIVKVYGADMNFVKEYVELKKQLGGGRKHDDNEIIIVHVSNFEEWDPQSIIKNGGGGSETACVELAQRWQKAGYKVTVYANPSKDGSKFKGVTWRKFDKLDLSDEFNIFISLRNHDLFLTYDIQAKKKFLWLQDIMNAEAFTPQLYDQLDKIIVLSQYHRNTAFSIPESKFYYTTNGINLKLIKEVEKEMKGAKRIKNKCLYISSADRGLQNLIDIWKEVKHKVPDATCYDYYGWNSWNPFNYKHATKARKNYQRGMKKAGIVEGGRIGKRELYKELLTADYHTYPLIGPAETSCIAVMESQALGAIPITTGITALEETQQYGVKVPLEEYKDALIANMTTEHKNVEKYRKEMMKWARETFNWDKVAVNWINDLFIK